MADARDGGAAFPTLTTLTDEYGNISDVGTRGGMSLRDYFAGQAIVGQGDKLWGTPPETSARFAYQLADAMLAERKKRKH